MLGRERHSPNKNAAATGDNGVMINGLGLFEGIGGITLGLQKWVRPIAFCENDPYAQTVLLERFPGVPIWDNVQTFPKLPVTIDIIYAGFPCQDISLMGSRKGLEGSRSGLFFEITKLVSRIRPTFVFLENVPAITVRSLERICMEFTKMGYDCRWTIVSAREIKARHIRERWFFLAHANRMQLRKECGEKNKIKSKSAGKTFDNYPRGPRRTAWASKRISKPTVARTGDGVPYKVDRARCLGNAVVPAQAEEAFKRLMGLK